MKRFVLFSRRQYRDSQDGAGYWCQEDGWTTLAGATVFAEHELSDTTARAMGGVRVPAPPLRVDREEAQRRVAELDVGTLVWIHDPETASLQIGGAAEALVDGHYTYLGRDDAGMANLAYPDGSRFAMPIELVHPSPFAAHIDAVRERLGEPAKLFAAVHCDAGQEWLQLTLSGVHNIDVPTGWQVIRDDAAGAVLRSEAPVLADWPVAFVEGDIVAVRDDDEGACSAIGSWVRYDEVDPERVTVLIGGVEQEVPRMCVFPTPATHARVAMEAHVARHRLGGRVAVECMPSGEDASHVVRLRLRVASDDVEAHEAMATIATREGYALRGEAESLVLERAIDPDAMPWMSEADIEAWGLVTPAAGGYFHVEDVEGAPFCTVWAVMEEADETLTLRAGFRRFDVVLGYVRTERPWATECERAIWAPGAPLGRVPRPAPAVPLPR